MPTINRKPLKYLKISALSPQTQSPVNNRSDIQLPDAVRITNWRTESVMTIFVDCWLRYDIDESWEVPGNEFIRMVRILVKQLHFFGNVAEQDMSSLSILRQQAQPMLNLRIYPFLKAVISRWPLDTSFLNILELWLSYIQPWRYMYNRNIQNLNNENLEINERFRTFINESILSYTQIFVRVLPRFLKMDLNVSKNAFMFFRMMKVFRQPSGILREIERNMAHNNSTVLRTTTSFNESSIYTLNSRSPNSFNRSGDRFSQHSNHRSHNQSAMDDSNYIFMFGDETTEQISLLMFRMNQAKLETKQYVEFKQKELDQQTSMWEKLMQFFGWFNSLNISWPTIELEERKKTPIYLDYCLDILSPVFNIQIEDVLDQHDHQQENCHSSNNNTMNHDESIVAKNQSYPIYYGGDPALMPIMSSEVKFLVRFLYPLALKFNEMVSKLLQYS